MGPEPIDTRLEIVDPVLSALLQDVRVAVLLLDPAGTPLFANPAAVFLFGLDLPYPPALPDLLGPGWREGTETREIDVEDREGVPRRVEVSTRLVSMAGEVRAAVVVRDLSAAEAAERNRQLTLALLERAKRDWEGTFDAIGECILLLANDRVFRVNRALADRVALPFDRILGRTVDELLGEEMAAAVRDSLAGSAPSPVDAPDLDGRFEVAAYPLPAAGSVTRRIVVILTEVTERERLRRQLVHTEKLSALGEIISGIAHELNNPLTGVLGFAQMLASKDEDGRFEREIAHIREEAQRATRIVRNLLAFARREEPTRSPADLNEVVRRAIDLREYDLRVRDIDLDLSFDPSLPQSEMDAGLMLQVVLNLLNNAEHAIRHGAGTGRIRIATRAAGEALELAVEDDGPGVAPEVREAIFEPFVTTKPVGSGTGLGLSVCAGILRDHGGSIRLDTDWEDGARFLVSIPRVATAGGEPERSGAAVASGPLRVLVVDDEPALRELASDFLAEAGHTVTTAPDGAAAIEQLRAGEFDVVVTDHRMPGVGGVELYERAIREDERYRNRFVLVSGDSGGESGSASGLRRLAKPLDFEELCRVVSETGRG